MWSFWVSMDFNARYTAVQCKCTVYMTVRHTYVHVPPSSLSNRQSETTPGDWCSCIGPSLFRFFVYLVGELAMTSRLSTNDVAAVISPVLFNFWMELKCVSEYLLFYWEGCCICCICCICYLPSAKATAARATSKRTWREFILFPVVISASLCCLFILIFPTTKTGVSKSQNGPSMRHS